MHANFQKKHMNKTFLIVTAVVVLTVFFLSYVVSEIIKTYKNRPYDPDNKKNKKEDERL